MSVQESKEIHQSSNNIMTKSNRNSPVGTPPTPIPRVLDDNLAINQVARPRGSNNTSNSSEIQKKSVVSPISQNSLSDANLTLNPPAPPPVRRSSFGLNFLSSITNSIRPHSNQGPQQAQNLGQNQSSQQCDIPHNFMSNSPTIGNLHTYTTSTNNDEIDISATENQDIFENNALNSGPISSNSESDQVAAEEIIWNNDGNNQSNATADISTKNNEQVDDSSQLNNGRDKDGTFSVRLTPLIDHSTSSSGLYFPPVIRKIEPNSNVSIGRYTEKNKAAAHAPQGSSAPIVFKSKVVSRTHALFQCNEDGQWFIRDCKSSSGTFLNHIRLSPASQESTLMPLIDGDIIQLGMDYRGGTEEVYRCVKMRCEFNKSWQRKVNQFNIEIHKKLKSLHIGNEYPSNSINGAAVTGDELSECAICLLKLEPCQALFISPCSHSWHYKCIRPIIIKSYPQFYCPNCRSMCDLETDIDDDDNEEEEEEENDNNEG